LAAGDCIEVVHRLTGESNLIPLGSLANRQGRVVGDNLAGVPTIFPPVAGSACVKVFGWNVAAVGISAERARRAGLRPREALGTFFDAAHYYPEHGKLFLKLVYEEGTRRLLGLQAMGDGRAVQRADVFASLLHREGRLEDLLDLEFCYAPPYNAALDPLHGLACAALNQEETGIDGLSPISVPQDRFVVDVRLPEEITAEQPSPAGAANIPSQELRGRLDEVPRDQPLLIFCAMGTRSAEAARWLAAEGFTDIVYLAGGAWMQAMR
jgi:rhodanese-related sulfurtransferase